MSSEEMTFELVTHQAFSLEELADAIAQSGGDLLGLVKEIDEKVADLDFSERLRDHLIRACAAEYDPTVKDPEAVRAHDLLDVIERK